MFDYGKIAKWTRTARRFGLLLPARVTILQARLIQAFANIQLLACSLRYATPIDTIGHLLTINGVQNPSWWFSRAWDVGSVKLMW
jgi:hypothetical protein